MTMTLAPVDTGLDLPELILARLIRGEASRRTGRDLRQSMFERIETKWIFALVTSWLELGVVSPTDDQIVLRTATGTNEAGEEFLASRPFLEETTEEALRAELVRLRGHR